MDCGPIIEKIYTSEQLNNLIGKIDPAALRDDLRQEIAITLLRSLAKRLPKCTAVVP